MLKTAIEAAVSAMQASAYNRGAAWGYVFDNTDMYIANESERPATPVEMCVIVERWGLEVADPCEEFENSCELPNEAGDVLNVILAEVASQYPNVEFNVNTTDDWCLTLSVKDK